MRILFELWSCSSLLVCTSLKTRADSERKYWGRPQRQKTSNRSQKGRRIRNNSHTQKEKYFLQVSPDTKPQLRLACDLQQTLQEVTTLPFLSERPPRKPRVQPPRPNLLLHLHVFIVHLLPTPEPAAFRHRPRATVRDTFRSSHWSRFLSDHSPQFTSW